MPFDKVSNRCGKSRAEQVPRQFEGCGNHLRRVGAVRYPGNDTFPETILIGSALKKEGDFIKMREPQIVPEQVPKRV